MRFLLIFTPAAFLAASAPPDPAIAKDLIALETRAMEGWIKGDPDPSLSAMADDVTIFDAARGSRHEGIAAVRSFYDEYRGKPLFESFEIEKPRVQKAGDSAVLTYRLIIRFGAETGLYNGTAVYQRRPEGWRLIHSHFSNVRRD